MAFGLPDPKKIQAAIDYIQLVLNWVIGSLQAIASKVGVTLPDPPPPPQL